MRAPEQHRGGECPVCEGSGKDDPEAGDESLECLSCDGTGEYEWLPFHADASGTCDYDECDSPEEERDLMVLGCVSYCRKCYERDHDSLCGCPRKVA